jgi:uncharacterized protein YjbI with pentapeptide repeats
MIRPSGPGAATTVQRCPTADPRRLPDRSRFVIVARLGGVPDMSDGDQPKRAGAGTPAAMFSVLVFGFGTAAGILLAFAGAGFVEQSGGLIVTVFLSALLVVGGLGGLVIAFRRPILRRLFGYADTQVELFADPLSRVATSTLSRDPAAATEAARELVALGLARYSWLAARRWVITSLTALIAAMAALAGTALLFKQNALLEVQTGLLAQQNDKIETQSALLSQQVQLAEAQRNAALAVEMTDIAALIGTATEVATARFRAEAPDLAAAQDPFDAMVNTLDPVTDLDRARILRIVSASRAARPYRFLDPQLRPDDPNDTLRVAMSRRKDDLQTAWARMSAAYDWQPPNDVNRLIDRPASPERGQLLDVLMSGGVRNLEVLNHFGLDLSFAYLTDATIILLTTQGARLSYADFSGSQMNSFDMGGGMLDNARFDRTVIRNSDFSAVGADRIRPPFRPADAPMPTIMAGASFRQAAVFDSSFAGARMIAADFDGALLFRVNFTDTTLSAATLKGALLVAPILSGVDLKSTDLDGALVFGADFLERLSADAAPESFRADRYRMDPVAASDIMKHRVANLQTTAEEISEATDGAAAFRLVRIKPLED